MNKRVLEKEISDIGIKIKSFEFSAAGYILEVRLDTKLKKSWEDLEEVSIDGLEFAKYKKINDKLAKIVLIPANEREFKDYIRRYVRAYNLNEDFALIDLLCIIEKFGSTSARMKFHTYKSVVIGRR